METKLIKILTPLGVPGVALGVFYLLLKGFGFNFSTIGPTWTAIIAILFLLVVGGVTVYALTKWDPAKNKGAQSIIVAQSEEIKKRIESEIHDNYQKIKNISNRDHRLPNGSTISASQANVEIARHVKIDLWKDLRSQIPSDLYQSLNEINMHAESIAVRHDDLPQKIRDIMLIDNAMNFVKSYNEYFGE